MTKVIRTLAVIAIGVILSACGSSNDDTLISDPQSDQQQVDGNLPVIGNILNDDEVTDAAAQGNVDFDLAELLFTEIDRQWFCSVSSSEFVSADDVYFSRSGTAVFSRFGLVYWNRNLLTGEINIASPSISSLIIRELRSSNTTLQFMLDGDAEVGQQYDCVLVGRTNIS